MTFHLSDSISHYMKTMHIYQVCVWLLTFIFSTKLLFALTSNVYSIYYDFIRTAKSFRIWAYPKDFKKTIIKSVRMKKFQSHPLLHYFKFLCVSCWHKYKSLAFKNIDSHKQKWKPIEFSGSGKSFTWFSNNPLWWITMTW